MRSMVAALSVLFSCSAAAQSVKPAVPAIPPVEPNQIQIEPMTISQVEPYSDSTTATIATNLTPDAPKTRPTVASTRLANLPNTPSPNFKPFQSINFNRGLVAAEFWARGLDAVSTRNKLKNPCNCYREASRFFGLDMTMMFKSDVRAYSYSLGVAATYSILSAKLWNASKDRPRHARLLQRLSRSLLIGDTSMEITADIHNLSLTNTAPLIK